ncbi:hypothetical protein ASPZODRAFT_128002 [Penicilliopsis zonata CBS 506.65]|uniref:Uncharacterized protein n=1 Tax=Penicilliopsis zonata CBS 506.65 TaxID=1073090 RepID=A0A1L9SQZ2_9EURO|nr:hypothetical protein ASPZODRAFT_128002 [Penicilliopsis zonata CBS 506.65]OJJ49527.1 hypothetical protein ASPZODRAFT_128002 [Penicilliopsis zonata CBS 506.65]
MRVAAQALELFTGQQGVIHAYRHLYRQGLKAIKYSTPARYALLNTLRSSFRSSAREELDPHKISNTLRFLQRATDVAGIEHKIVKNLMIVRYWEQPLVKKTLKTLDQTQLSEKGGNEHFNKTLILLNESLGMCLR